MPSKDGGIMITAGYTGSKYWNEDANEGIKKGALMILAPVGAAYAPVDYTLTLIANTREVPKSIRTIVVVMELTRGTGLWKMIKSVWRS